jgi:dihydroorotate dehydrogenase (NAD+) catalytic subunit
MTEKAFDFRTRFGNRYFPNPIFTASGCAGSGKELANFFDLKELGAIVTKSIAVKPRSGRATPRMAETPSGMLNSIGLQGPGIDQFLENDIPWLASRGARIIVSISGETVEEYASLARRLRGIDGLSGVEVNISCPNVENRGLVFACDPTASRAVVESVRRNIAGDYPMIVKLSPDVTDIVSIAREVVSAGADALALINTVLGMVIDIEGKRPKLAESPEGFLVQQSVQLLFELFIKFIAQCEIFQFLEWEESQTVATLLNLYMRVQAAYRLAPQHLVIQPQLCE